MSSAYVLSLLSNDNTINSNDKYIKPKSNKTKLIISSVLLIIVSLGFFYLFMNFKSLRIILIVIYVLILLLFYLINFNDMSFFGKTGASNNSNNSNMSNKSNNINTKFNELLFINNSKIGIIYNYYYYNYY